MIFIHKDVSNIKATKPIVCPNCGNKRTFDVPAGAIVRKSKRGRPPPDSANDVVLIKCKKCDHQFGISIEQDDE